MLANNDYDLRMEYAKMCGRQFYNSLDQSLKKLPIDICKIVENDPNWSLHFDCLYGEEGYTIYKNKKGKKKYKVCVESYDEPFRRRFTVAHELGHIVLGHFEKYCHKPLTYYDEYITDKEADMFAGEILMPYEYILKYYKWSTKGLSTLFRATPKAITVRLHVLEREASFLKDLSILNKKNRGW